MFMRLMLMASFGSEIPARSLAWREPRHKLVFFRQHDREHTRGLGWIGRVFRAEFERLVVIVDLPEDALAGRCQGNGGSSTCSATAISRAAVYAARERHSANAAERLCL